VCLFIPLPFGDQANNYLLLTFLVPDVQQLASGVFLEEMAALGVEGEDLSRRCFVVVCLFACRSLDQIAGEGRTRGQHMSTHEACDLVAVAAEYLLH
jgi:hypothetical protein